MARRALLASVALSLLAGGVARASVPRVVDLPRSPSASISSIRVPDFADEGLRTNGRIFGFDPREGAYSCSGTALNTPSHSIVLTAGHCVQEEGIVGRDLVFVPAYDHEARPFGTFFVDAIYMMPQWRHGENPDFDVAALKVAPSPLGALTDVVGGRGYAIDRSRHSNYQIYGYPAAALKGQELRSCQSHGLGLDPLTTRFLGPPTLPGSCDMAGGSSGGAWLVDGAYVAGVTSYGYTGNPGRLYSPYFGNEVGGFLAALP